jgi:NADH:ubiquinone oxidoreductase subunit C
MEANDGMPVAPGIWDVAPDWNGVKWVDSSNLSLRQLTMALKEKGARFVTITAYELPDDQGFCLEYLWDLKGQLLGSSQQIADHSASSIYDICEAADWIEREIREEFAIEFSGRSYEPLLLRKGDASGVNLREVMR